MGSTQSTWGSFSSNLFRRNIITLIMIAKITLVSCLAAIAMAAPEPQLGYGLAGGVVSSVPAACTPSTEEIEIQSCAPTAESGCSTADVVSEEITYEKRCKEVVNKHCAHVGGYAHAGLIVKREADAEADAQVFGYGGLHHGLGYAGYAHPAPVAVALPAPVTKTIETPCTEVATEHCVDVPIVKDVVPPVETCHVVTKVVCTPAVHSIPKVTCEAGVTEIVEHPVLAHHGAYAYGR